METTRIEQLYKQCLTWPEAKVLRHLLARSAEKDKVLVLALTLSQLYRRIEDEGQAFPLNDLEDPDALVDYLIQELHGCADSDRAATIRILCSIAQRCVHEGAYIEAKPMHKLLTTCAIICQSFARQSTELVSALREIEMVAQTSLNLEDVMSFARGDCIKLGLHYEVGQKLMCKIQFRVVDGYAVLITGDEVPGFVRTSQTLYPETSIPVYFIGVNERRALLSLVPVSPEFARDAFL